MDGERQMSLEELIQDETTDEVIESTTTASQKMSVDNTTASEVTAADERMSVKKRTQPLSPIFHEQF